MKRNVVVAPLDRGTAVEYASWFRALADATRVQIVSLLARAEAPLNVGQIVASLDVGQSTVSAHLKALVKVRFVLAEDRGTARYYRINDACLACFPTAADVVMGRPVPSPPEPPPDTQEISMNERDAVIAHYSDLARTAAAGGAPVDTSDGTEMTGCGPTAYRDLDGLPDDALRASLGCGNPVAVADLQPGDTVLDLGAGGGLDVLLSARRVGPTGHVYGLDASPDMVALARRNARQATVTNVEFLTGYLEDIPLPAASVDVIISNCVINLSTDKPRALAEAARVLRPGGRLGITDVLAADNLEPAQRAAAEHAVGCAAGTLTIGDYRQHLHTAGFTNITITPTHELAEGLTSAIIQAHTPTI